LFIPANWSVVWIGVLLISLSVGLHLAGRRRAQQHAHTWRSGIFMRWAPLTIGMLLVVVYLPRVLGASPGVVSITDEVSHVFLVGSIVLVLQALIVAVTRCVRKVAHPNRNESTS
jgi:hypothetical protein